MKKLIVLLSIFLVLQTAKVCIAWFLYNAFFRSPVGDMLAVVMVCLWLLEFAAVGVFLLWNAKRNKS